MRCLDSLFKHSYTNVLHSDYSEELYLCVELQKNVTVKWGARIFSATVKNHMQNSSVEDLPPRILCFHCY